MFLMISERIWQNWKTTFAAADEGWIRSTLLQAFDQLGSMSLFLFHNPFRSTVEATSWLIAIYLGSSVFSLWMTESEKTEKHVIAVHSCQQSILDHVATWFLINVHSCPAHFCETFAYYSSIILSAQSPKICTYYSKIMPA